MFQLKNKHWVQKPQAFWLFLEAPVHQTVNMTCALEVHHHSAKHSSTWLKLTTHVKCFARSQPSIHQGLRLSCPAKMGLQECIMGRPPPIVISLLTKSKESHNLWRTKTQKLGGNDFEHQLCLRSHLKFWNNTLFEGLQNPQSIKESCVSLYSKLKSLLSCKNRHNTGILKLCNEKLFLIQQLAIFPLTSKCGILKIPSVYFRAEFCMHKESCCLLQTQNGSDF